MRACAAPTRFDWSRNGRTPFGEPKRGVLRREARATISPQSESRPLRPIIIDIITSTNPALAIHTSNNNIISPHTKPISSSPAESSKVRDNKTPATVISIGSSWSQEVQLMRVTINPQGRFIFLALTLVVLLILGLLGTAIATVEEQHRWLPGIAAVLAGLAFILLFSIVWLGPLYLLRLVNISFLLLMAIAAAVVDGMLFQRIEPHPSVFLATSASLLVAYLIFMALVLLPGPHSDFAHRFHPFVADSTFGDAMMTSASSSAAGGGRGSTKHHGRRRIKHREVSIFEDWPAPVPFPAKALYTYRTTVDSELAFQRGDQLTILDCRGNWWQAKHPQTNKTGFVPSNYIQVLQKGRVVKTFEGKDQDEVTILEGQEIEVMEMHEYMSLVRNVEGKIGSVPTDCINVDPIDLSSIETQEMTEKQAVNRPSSSSSKK